MTNENIFNVTTVEEVFDPEKRGFDSMIDPLFDVLVEQSMQMKSKFD